MSGQLTAETLARLIAEGLSARAILASPERADDIEAIRRETLLAAADAYGPEGTDATDWLHDRAEAAS